jgi:threonine dehydrogenase-like Zn-dependent dehydrogenase
VLLEPTTIVGKAWEQVERIGQRAFFDPKVVAITGAGPVGLLAALLGAQRNLEVHVYDRVTEGLKPKLVADLGGHYHSESLPESGVEADIIIECTGVSSVIEDAMTHSATDSIVCLTGVSAVGTQIQLDLGSLNRNAVLRNDVIFGSVNANRRHYEAAAAALHKADPDWLAKLITRQVPVDNYADAFNRQPDDVKVVITW